MDLTSGATLASPAATTPGQRAARCQVLDITRRGVNRCANEAIDPVGEILICAVHLGAVLALAGRQDGIAITLTAP